MARFICRVEWEEGNKMTDCAIIHALHKHCLVFGHRTLSNGHIRIDTKLLYPDGASIAIFVESGDLLRNERRVISDFGMTFAKLAEFQVNPRQTKARFQAIEETVGDFGVRIVRDQLTFELTDVSLLGDCIINFSQACLRASCMIFNRRIAQQTSLAEDVREVVKSTGLPFEPKYRFKGPFQKDVEVDYRVSGPSKHSSILTLGGGHVQANEVFRKWSDLKWSNVDDRLITIYDERREVQRKEDLERLERVSEVLSLVNRKGIEMRLKAAS
jgi:Domain of unknown function DUF1828